MSQRRRKNYGVKRPKSQVSVATSVIGVVCILLYLLFISITMVGFEAGARAMAGMGVLAALICVIAFSRSIEPFRDTSYDTFTRWSGLLLPIAGFFVWIITYFVGIIFG